MSADKRWQVRIEHVLEAIGKIERDTVGLTEGRADRTWTRLDRASKRQGSRSLPESRTVFLSFPACQSDVESRSDVLSWAHRP